MEVKAKDLNRTCKLATESAMNVVKAAFPKLPREALKDLAMEMQDSISDMVESHTAGVTDEELGE